MLIYRVTVRGHFKGLTNSAKSYLLTNLGDHDLFRSSFTEEGTFTYDQRLVAFNLRYEVRIDDASSVSTAESVSAPEEQALGVALLEATSFLQTMRISHGPLRPAVMDMSAMTTRLAR